MAEPAMRISAEAYLAEEAIAGRRHEFLNGAIIAMAGASARHNLIAANVMRALGNALAAGPCRVLGSDQRVRIGLSDAYLYPDVTVVCASPRFADDRPASLLNPSLVVEVLSPSTVDHDRGAKLAHYRRLPSLGEILLIEPNERRLEVYRRLASGQWLITDVLDGAVELESVGASLSLDEVYAKTVGLPLDAAE
ncbi:MAG: Uma2 family endonuclease [Myxococcales bacterium]|nr:Uma2 family endonuclease [Myxococcales bacterium]